MAIGRPKIYDSVEELTKACEEYFLKCSENKLRPTVTGLTLYLGFADKSTLYDYRDRDEFSHPIKTSLTMIENALEEKLEQNNVAGIIFALKNMGWADKQEISHLTPVPVVWKEERTYETKDV
jgi:hypothetical protein